MSLRDYAGDEVVVHWDSDLCVHSATCYRELPEAFKPTQRPWVQPGHVPPDVLVAQILRCPSGALTYTLTATEEPGEDGGTPADPAPVEAARGEAVPTEAVAGDAGSGDDRLPEVAAPAPGDADGAVLSNAEDTADEPADGGQVRSEQADDDRMTPEPVDGEPAHGEPSRGDATRSEPSRSEPTRADLAEAATAPPRVVVTVQPDGPYLVRGEVEVRTADGQLVTSARRLALCRCGRSESKPFCDGSHARTGFRDPGPARG